MTDVQTYTQCDKCKFRIQVECLQFHECEQEKKIKEVEDKIQSALDENAKLKVQNSELQKSIESISKEVNESFSQMRSIVDGYIKKQEESKVKKEEKKEDVKA